jgi:hypothetical protein
MRSECGSNQAQITSADEDTLNGVDQRSAPGASANRLNGLLRSGDSHEFSALRGVPPATTWHRSGAAAGK